MEPLRPELVAALDALAPRDAEIPMYSTVTTTVQEGHQLDNRYWGRNLRSPVQFAQTVTNLLENDHYIFIEMSPHPLLLRAVDEIFINWDKSGHHACLTLPSGIRDEDDADTLLDSLGKIYTAGYPLDWDVFYSQPTSKIDLPAYPWQRQRFWIDTIPPGGRSRSARKIIAASVPDDGDGFEEKTDAGDRQTDEFGINFRESIQAAQTPKAREGLLENLLQHLLSRILGLPAARLDANKAFKAYGMDSLKAMQFRSGIESATGLELSSSLVWNYPNLQKLAAYLNDTLSSGPGLTPSSGSGPSESQEESISGGSEQLSDLVDMLESMTDEEAKKLLEDKP